VRWCLLFTKALSLKAEYPHCPILGPFADWVIQCCLQSGYRLVRHYDEDPGWHAYKIDHSTSLHTLAVVPISARLLMESLYRISVPEQLTIERQFSGSLHYLRIPEILDHVPDVWRWCWDTYVHLGPVH
jgi:hypothetical protein